MEHLADTNILIRRIDRAHAQQVEATTAVRALLRSGERVCVAPQNMIEFWNVCTRPLERNGLGLSPAEADREVSRLEGILTLLPDVPAIYPEWRRLVVAHWVSGYRFTTRALWLS
jgi:predicted nucleic acid-binding protein